MSSELQPEKICGGEHSDARGLLRFNNKLDLVDFKRAYIIENSNLFPFRGWHGHLHESKIFICTSGAVRIGAVRMPRTRTAGVDSKIHTFDLVGLSTDAVFVPSGFANGILSLEPNSSVLVFSSSTLEESQSDDYRYPPSQWDILS